MNKKFLLLIPIFFVLITALFINIQSTNFTVFGVGVADAYGNRIVSLMLKQWNGTDWNYFTDEYFHNGTSTFDGQDLTQGGTKKSYTVAPNGFTWRVADNYPLEFFCWVALNKTFASSLAQAWTYTRCKLNITGSGYAGLVNGNFSVTVGEYSRPNYYLLSWMYLWNVTSYPQAGVTYSVSVEYDAYY